MSEFCKLLRDVYSCAHCPRDYGFCDSPNGSYFKFPPLIGATGLADILFVGINPRRSTSNRVLHEQLMTSKWAFAALASNRIRGESYIGVSGQERHYHDHLQIIREVYGEAVPFESRAVVTELFFCATETSNSLPSRESPCAERFLPRVLTIVQPKVIVAVGSRVMSYFRINPVECRAADEIISCIAGCKYGVVRMPHPGNKGLSDSQRRAEIGTCIRKVRKWLSYRSAT